MQVCGVVTISDPNNILIPKKSSGKEISLYMQTSIQQILKRLNFLGVIPIHSVENSSRFRGEAITKIWFNPGNIPNK